jgi:hypothetical protein
MLPKWNCVIQGGKKGTGTFCLKGPKGAPHKRCLSPFFRHVHSDLAAQILSQATQIVFRLSKGGGQIVQIAP